MTLREFIWAFGKMLAYAVTGAVVLLAVLTILSAPSTQERRQTARNVARLVEENQLNRELICLAVLQNPNNPARDNPRVMEICADVGVEEP